MVPYLPERQSHTSPDRADGDADVAVPADGAKKEGPQVPAGQGEKEAARNLGEIKLCPCGVVPLSPERSPLPAAVNPNRTRAAWRVRVWSGDLMTHANLTRRAGRREGDSISHSRRRR